MVQFDIVSLIDLQTTDKLEFTVWFEVNPTFSSRKLSFFILFKQIYPSPFMLSFKGKSGYLDLTEQNRLNQWKEHETSKIYNMYCSKSKQNKIWPRKSSHSFFFAPHVKYLTNWFSPPSWPDWTRSLNMIVYTPSTPAQAVNTVFVISYIFSAPYYRL